MKENESSPPQSETAHWQTLGKLDLPIDSQAGERITAWLKDTLCPLELQMDFINKVIKSASEIVRRASDSGEVRHLHCIVFALEVGASKEKNWGFFRIEKLENVAGSESPHEHTIEFYIYLES